MDNVTGTDLTSLTSDMLDFYIEQAMEAAGAAKMGSPAWESTTDWLFELLQERARRTTNA